MEEDVSNIIKIFAGISEPMPGGGDLASDPKEIKIENSNKSLIKVFIIYTQYI